MYSGMADVAALTGDTAYVSAIKAIWDNVAERRSTSPAASARADRGEALEAL